MHHNYGVTSESHPCRDCVWPTILDAEHYTTCPGLLRLWASCWNHYLDALDLGAGIEQPFNCLIVQNRQAMQSMGRLMDWTLEDNMVDSLFFCATLTGHRRGHQAISHLYKQEQKRPTSVRRRINRTQALLGGLFRVG